MFVNPLDRNACSEYTRKKIEHVFECAERVNYYMINNIMANGTSSINPRTTPPIKLRTYRFRQKQYGRYLKILFFLVAALIVYLINTGLPGPDEQIIYQPVIVQHGDTLWGLAENTGIHMDTHRLVLKIMVYNSLANSTILPGQTIYIPTSM
jgi:hypothetical protein